MYSLQISMYEIFMPTQDRFWPGCNEMGIRYVGTANKMVNFAEIKAALKCKLLITGTISFAASRFMVR